MLFIHVTFLWSGGLLDLGMIALPAASPTDGNLVALGIVSERRSASTCVTITIEALMPCRRTQEIINTVESALIT